MAFTNLEGIFQYYQNQIAYLAGQQCNIYRPPQGYVVDQTPVLVQQGVRMKYEVAGVRFASPRLTNIEYYAIFGDRYLFQSGDIISSQESSSISTSPDIVVLNYSPIEEAIG